VRWLWGVWIPAERHAVARGRARFCRQQSLVVKEISQRETADAATGLKQEIASRPKTFHRRHLI
jgi:hypothetical protein